MYVCRIWYYLQFQASIGGLRTYMQGVPESQVQNKGFFSQKIVIKEMELGEARKGIILLWMPLYLFTW